MDHQNRNRFLMLVILVITLPSAGWAEAGLQVPVGARAIAMGGAFAAVADDATASYWNAAGLPWIGHQEICTNYANLYGSEIKDNFASFVLPLSRSQAAAIDWYQSGFQDSELDFGETRIDLSYGRRLHPKFSLGATAKYLSRHTDLDNVTVRRGSGFGFDFGVLFRPVESLRFATVAQDAFDTEINYTEGYGTVVAFPRTIRVGVAYSPFSKGQVAVDVDDRWHAGVEYRPLEPLALRAGIQDALDGQDERTYSFGAGLHWNVLRFDYAIEDHAVLGATNYFGLSLAFNFNPSQIRIEEVKVRDLYASLYRSYAREPIGTVRIRNLEDSPISARLRVLVPDLMSEASEQEILLRPGATQEFPLTVVLPGDVVTRRGDRPVQVDVSATYQSRRLPRTDKVTSRCVAYGPGAIDWSQGVAQAAAFVTTRDPAVEALAREAVRLMGDVEGATGNRNLDFAVAIFDAVGNLGVKYVPDPNNPYTTISDIPRAVDTILYPSETLAKRTGDCDDTTVLLAALLGNVGIRSMFVDVPGHIFLLVGTGVHERNLLALGLEDSRFVVADSEVWIPVETTALGRGFAEAWSIGIESYGSWSARNRVQLVDIGEAQGRYEPAELPGTPPEMPLDLPRYRESLTMDLAEIGTWRQGYFASRYSGIQDELEPSPDALNEIARLYFSAGRLEQAQIELEHAAALEPGSARSRNNLGAVKAAQGDLAGAVESFRAAAEIDGDDPGPWLNLGLTLYAAGDSIAAQAPLARGVDLSGGYAEACALLGLLPDASDGRSGTKQLTAEEARELLKSALHRVPPPAPTAPAPQAPPAAPASPAPQAPAKPAPWKSRVAGGRAADRTALADLLYWKP